MDEAVFELDFGETEFEWMESKEEHSSGNSLGPILSVVLEKQDWGMVKATELRANKPGRVIWGCAVLCAVLSWSVVSDSLWPHRLQPARLLCHGDSPGKNTGVDCHALLQGIWGWVTDNSEYPVKEFRFTCGKAFELKFDVIQHVYFRTMTKEVEWLVHRSKIETESSLKANDITHLQYWVGRLGV